MKYYYDVKIIFKGINNQFQYKIPLSLKDNDKEMSKEEIDENETGFIELYFNSKWTWVEDINKTKLGFKSENIAAIEVKIVSLN